MAKRRMLAYTIGAEVLVDPADPAAMAATLKAATDKIGEVGTLTVFDFKVRQIEAPEPEDAEEQTTGPTEPPIRPTFETLEDAAKARNGAAKTMWDKKRG